ncbi:LysR family transcriptional regulator [Sneathiella chungangensis]|uniref:LysR family transcriptional regulator n=1 Tax=Sneathiella chungangensis TaxID=1418234 RepID=A0A845MFV3_9PROT|nr:LysR family transcriptional regulator [Sneathiella chungangensis]MZR22330.1 LysR family transcriptional regulator [Sneathiella chungangensis]
MLKATLTQWQIFNAVIDHGGYLQAAEKLNRSHSSLHHAVQKLQDQLGMQLVTVAGKQVRLTPIGEVMRRRSLQLIEDAKDLERLAETALQGWETEIRVAVEGIYPKDRLIEVLREFHEQGHGTRLKIENVFLNGAVEAIRTAAADMVVSPIVPSGFLGTPLMRVPLSPFAGKDHPLIAQNSPIETGELQRHLQIVISDGTKTELPITVGWLKSEQRWTVSGFHQARDILLSGIGFCWLPAHLFQEDIDGGNLCRLDTRDKLEALIPLSLVIPAPEKLGPAGRLLADLFRKRAVTTP